MEKKSINSAIEYVNLVDVDYESARWAEASADIWCQVLQEYPDLEGEVVLNKKLPDKILEIFSKDADADIRFSVAMKRRLPDHLFLELSSD